jgi:hypothetical protein
MIWQHDCLHVCMITQDIQSVPNPEATPVDERRRHLRHEWAGIIDVHRTTIPQASRIGPALVENISTGGLRMTMDLGIAPGTQIRLRNRYVDCLAVVRYSESHALGYFVGVEFAQPLPPSLMEYWANVA